MKKHVSISKAHRTYRQHAGHTVYAVGFTLNGKEYVISVKELSNSWLYWDYSRDDWRLRLRLTETVKQMLANKAGCVLLGNTEDVYSTDCEYNKGDQLERILYEAITGKTWQKDYTPWYEGADINVCDSVKIQVKRDRATLCSMARINTFLQA